VGILATVNDKKSEVAKKKAVTPKMGKPETRGRPQIELPVEAIMEMAKASLRALFARETLERERPLFPHSGLSARLKSLVDNPST